MDRWAGVKIDLQSFVFIESEAAMTAFIAREIRFPVMIEARVRTGRGLMDAKVCNISACGMLLQVRRALAPGLLLEILRPGSSFSGQVVWVVGKLAGIRIREPIDLMQVLRTGRLPDHAAQPVYEIMLPMRRAVTLARLARIQGQLFQLLLVGVVVAGAAWLAADMVAGVLHVPLSEVRGVLHLAQAEPASDYPSWGALRIR